MANTFIMRWNPAISSYTLADYANCRKSPLDIWFMDWSVYEWQSAHAGDYFYMLREGDGVNPGIVFRGKFISDPYEGKDWGGKKGFVRRYVDMICVDGADAGQSPWLTPEQLEQAIPDINWRRGHSGELLTPDQAEALNGLFVSI